MVVIRRRPGVKDYALAFNHRMPGAGTGREAFFTSERKKLLGAGNSKFLETKRGFLTKRRYPLYEQNRSFYKKTNGAILLLFLLMFREMIQQGISILRKQQSAGPFYCQGREPGLCHQGVP
ncbi:MAG: hypothetical protein PVG49_03735 [Desulfobacteraceae bacterium]